MLASKELSSVLGIGPQTSILDSKPTKNPNRIRKKKKTKKNSSKIFLFVGGGGGGGPVHSIVARTLGTFSSVWLPCD